MNPATHSAAAAAAPVLLGEQLAGAGDQASWLSTNCEKTLRVFSPIQPCADCTHWGPRMLQGLELHQLLFEIQIFAQIFFLIIPDIWGAIKRAGAFWKGGRKLGQCGHKIKITHRRFLHSACYIYFYFTPRKRNECLFRWITVVCAGSLATTGWRCDLKKKKKEKRQH